MNRVFMMGRIVNDLELKTTPNGTSVCTFRIAVDRNYQKKGEEKVTDFFNVTAWRGTAEFLVKYFAKGRMILIEGEMQTRQYTDKNSNPATWYEIIVSNVFFTGEKKDGDTATNTNPPQSSNKTTYGTSPSSYGEVSSFAQSDVDDYPF